MHGFPEVYLLDESKNLSGTYKDRRSLHIVTLASQEGVSTLALITSGNAGHSLGLHARPKGIRVVSIVDTQVKESVKEKLRESCDAVIERDLSYDILKSEDVIRLARTSDDEVIWDVTNGYSVAYQPIIAEIRYKGLEYLICPVGSGEAFVGLYLGLKEHGLHTTLVGVGVQAHPSFADKLSTSWTPYEGTMKEILSEGHLLFRLDEEEVRKAYEDNKERCESEPSSAVVWAGLEKLDLLPGTRVGVLNSGKGIC